MTSAQAPKVTFRTTLESAGETATGFGVKAGDAIDVTLQLDTAAREVVVPEDFGKALDAVPPARKTFDSLSFSHKRAHVDAIEQAKATETRQRRIEKSVAMLAEAKSR